jgi:hypothetical protein
MATRRAEAVVFVGIVCAGSIRVVPLDSLSDAVWILASADMAEAVTDSRWDSPATFAWQPISTPEFMATVLVLSIARRSGPARC